MAVRLPSKPTLQRYGITLDEWLGYLGVTEQTVESALCAVCGRQPPSGRFVTDHEHVRGWKNMPPDERKRFVRGVVCTTCNHFILTRYGTPRKHRGAADYLEAYERRKRGASG